MSNERAPNTKLALDAHGPELAEADVRLAIGRLKAELAIERARVGQLEGEVARNEMVISDTLAELQDADARGADLRDDALKSEALIESLRAGVEDTQKELTAARREAEAHKRSAETGRIEALAAALRQSEQAAAAHARQIAELERRLKDLETRPTNPVPVSPVSVDPTPAPPAVSPAKRLSNWIASRMPRTERLKALAFSSVPTARVQQQGIEASGMFDAAWYVGKYPDVKASGLEPLAHYVKFGWREGRDPAAGFSTTFYLESNPDVRASGMNPLYHYVAIGRYQRRVPSADAKYVEGLDQSAIVGQEFAPDFYLSRHRIQLPEDQALEHFMKRGWKEGYDPHPQFSTRYYLKENPDVWRAGINPYVHYLIAGRREGRLPRPLPNPSSELIQQWRIVARDFDAQFYGAKYPDVVAARFEPILHYLIEGWKQERDPHPQFSTSHYLDTNPDVREAGVNPYLHFLTEGRREGRSPKPAGAWAPRSEVRKAIAGSFDPDFYLAVNPDIAAAAVDPLEHFLDYGWKERRDPNADFSTSYYLESNPDVAAARVNPFYHYLIAGRLEGRSPAHPGSWRALALQRLQPLEKQFEAAKATAPPVPRSLAARELVAAIRTQGLELDARIFVTFSQDDYTTSVGGVQLCLKMEEQHARERGITHINVHPALPLNALSRDRSGDEIDLVVTCNGVTVGAATAKELTRAFRIMAREAARTDLAVHSLLAHSSEAVANLHAALRPTRSFLWLHDFFSLCPSYTLLRNGITYCSAPRVKSPACNLCLFGEERREHEGRMRALFAAIDFEVIAPSRFAADFWQSKANLPKRKLHVQNHCALREATRSGVRAEGPIRVAFLGHPSPHKGWDAFLRVLRELKDDPRYEFHHLGAGRRRDNRTTFTYASVAEGGPHAMAEALSDKDIDVALLWSIWPETFSFVAHEALSAGASILTCEDSGNIARIVRDRDCGAVMRDEDALVEAFRDGSVATMAQDARAAPPKRFQAEFSEMTFSILEQD